MRTENKKNCCKAVTIRPRIDKIKILVLQLTIESLFLLRMFLVWNSPISDLDDGTVSEKTEDNLNSELGHPLCYVYSRM